MFCSRRLWLVLGGLFLTAPSISVAQTSAGVGSAFAAPSEAPPTSRSDDQRLCDVASRNIRGFSQGTTFEVRTDAAFEAFDSMSTYHREALVRWMMQVMRGTSEIPATVHATPDGLHEYVVQHYTPVQIAARFCGASLWPEAAGGWQPLMSDACPIRFVWSAAFQYAPWCAAVGRGARLRYDQPGLILGTIAAELCIADPPGSYLSANPHPCPTDIGRIVIQGRGISTQASERAPVDVYYGTTMLNATQHLPLLVPNYSSGMDDALFWRND